MKPTQPQPETNTPGHAQTAPSAPPAEPSKPERRNYSKVAQLPKPLRQLVNSMLDDGLPYSRITEKLKQSTDPPLPFPISKMTISRWYDTGYQAYLDRQDHLAELRANREAALELVEGGDTTTLPEATLQIVTSQIFQLLTDFSSASLKKKLAEDPLKYIRLVNSFAHISREAVVLKKLRDASAKATAAELKRLDPQREFSDRENQILADRLDDFFLKPRRRPPGDAPAQTSPPKP